MNPIIRKWIDALRGDKYKQTYGRLCRYEEEGPRHCPLGVLCEIAFLEGLVMRDDYRSGRGYNGAVTGLPDSLSRRAGMTKGLEQSIIAMNDKQRLTFPQIADALEKEFGQRDLFRDP